MTGHTGAREETVEPSGPFRLLLAVPFALVLFGGLIVLALKGAAYVTEFLPDFPLVVDMLLLAVLVSILFYGGFRISDVIRGLVRR